MSLFTSLFTFFSLWSTVISPDAIPVGRHIAVIDLTCHSSPCELVLLKDGNAVRLFNEEGRHYHKDTFSPYLHRFKVRGGEGKVKFTKTVDKDTEVAMLAFVAIMAAYAFL